MATRRIVFVPIKHGGHIELGDSSTLTPKWGALGGTCPHVYLGFKPSPGKTRSGWAIFAVLGSAPSKPKRKL